MPNTRSSRLESGREKQTTYEDKRHEIRDPKRILRRRKEKRDAAAAARGVLGINL